MCGAAAESGRTEIVGDVSADPRYLACFASTKSEIVVPIFDGGEVIGEIDIDGSDLDAFDDDRRPLPRGDRRLPRPAATAAVTGRVTHR